MAKVQPLVISVIILFNICCIYSQTNAPSVSPTREPTNEPTSEPTLYPTSDPITSTTSIPVPSTSTTKSSANNATFIEKNYLWLIIGGAALFCICWILIVFIIRNKRNKNRLNSELQKTNQAIEDKKDSKNKSNANIDSLPDEQRPMTGSVSPSINDNNQQQFNMQQQQEMQQMAMMQQYQTMTNFQDPQNIAAWQALQFCPPINHDGVNWKELDHLQPQQRMLQLMHQHQYIQQVANQTAIAMAYFIEQQQKIQELQRASQVTDNNMNNKINNEYREKIGSVSYDNKYNVEQDRMSMPGQLKPKRNDTMDVLLDVDLPPSMANDNVLYDDDDNHHNEPGNDDNFKFNKGGEKTLLELDPVDQPKMANIYDDDYKNDMEPDENEEIDDINNVQQKQPLVPPPNPMEMQSLNIIKKQEPNMRKIESLPQEIPDLPIGQETEYNEEYNHHQYNNQYYEEY